ncbi:MAG: shikimate dehydrogenase [Clostridia bacterium]|nr:shikimate dehydrogenase [Clostridia bacterium]
MKFGCIGEHLAHSFSKEIHNKIGEYDYILREVARDELDRFMTERDFLGINVTIPYKLDVIPHLYEISPQAKEIGAVNTIVNKDGRLYGYNTDFFGMSALIRKIGLELKGKKVLILGTGGTSKTANAVARSMEAGEVITVGRTGKNGSVTYEEVYEKHTDAQIIINTTPCGMYPNIDGCPVDVHLFPNLEGAMDAIYNPLRPVFVQQVQKRGLPAEGGLYMLVAQAVYAAEKFMGKTYGTEIIDDIFNQLVAQKENIVLTGMPGSGKTTVGKILADKTGFEFVDTDEYIEHKTGRHPSAIISSEGIEAFRDMESDAIHEISAKSGCVIATGGGAILRSENVDWLKQNGKIYFIDRPLEDIIPTDDRPLSSSPEDLERRYNERYDIYCTTADEVIKVSSDAEGVAEMILTKR